MEGVRLVNRNEKNTIAVKDLEYGVLAEIVSWGGLPGYKGIIVQRTGKEELHIVGYNDSWDNLSTLGTNFRVRILEKGEILEV